jgi:hypothetical protein
MGVADRDYARERLLYGKPPVVPPNESRITRRYHRRSFLMGWAIGFCTAFGVMFWIIVIADHT